MRVERTRRPPGADSVRSSLRLDRFRAAGSVVQAFDRRAVASVRWTLCVLSPRLRPPRVASSQSPRRPPVAGFASTRRSSAELLGCCSGADLVSGRAAFSFRSTAWRRSLSYSRQSASSQAVAGFWLRRMSVEFLVVDSGADGSEPVDDLGVRRRCRRRGGFAGLRRVMLFADSSESVPPFTGYG